MLNILNLKSLRSHDIRCDACGKQFKIKKLKSKQFKGESLKCSYFNCPLCKEIYVVSAENDKLIQMLKEVSKDDSDFFHTFPQDKKLQLLRILNSKRQLVRSYHAEIKQKAKEKLVNKER